MLINRFNYKQLDSSQDKSPQQQRLQQRDMALEAINQMKIHYKKYLSIYLNYIRLGVYKQQLMFTNKFYHDPKANRIIYLIILIQINLFHIKLSSVNKKNNQVSMNYSYT